jgi:N6-adenosine-specific RNA methylase IME4
MNGLPSKTYSVLLIDPPFGYSRSVGKGVAANHYQTLTDTDIGKLPLYRIAATNALLFFWCSGPTINRAIELCQTWGFVYKTIAFVWVKTNVAGEPQPMGLGSYTLPGVELVLLATKGRGAPLVVKRVPQVVTGRRGAHSEKPAAFRTIIDKMTGNDRRVKKIELFSRARSDDNWSAWGDQLDKQFTAPTREKHTTVARPKKKLKRDDQKQNAAAAASKFRGVSYNRFKQDKRWFARTRIKRCREHLGYFKTEIEAALAYNAACHRLNRPASWLNDISDD